MSQSLSKIWTHLIFSTKERYPFLTNETVRHDMHSYLAKILKANHCPTLLVGGVSDHVHALFVLSKNHSIASIVWAIKRSSSKWVKTQGGNLGKFHWQEGYGAFSVSQSDVERVERYILNQETHHKRKTFQEEFRGSLKKYEVDYVERYVWD
jgi:REP element-mobilizing transposase RayT